MLNYLKLDLAVIDTVKFVKFMSLFQVSQPKGPSGSSQGPECQNEEESESEPLEDFLQADDDNIPEIPKTLSRNC